MRRRTAGVLRRDELLPLEVVRAEQGDPEETIATLEPFVLERRRKRILDVIDARIASVTVVFDSPYDPHNGAAVIRTCEAMGVQALHVIERNEPFLTAATVSRGTEKWVDVHRYSSADDAITVLKDQRMTLVATHPRGDLLPSDLQKIERLALVLGNEHEGIASDLGMHCAHRVRVPMRGMVESLNVSVTCAILLHEATAGRPGDLDASEKRRLYARGLYFSVQRAKDMINSPIE